MSNSIETSYKTVVENGELEQKIHPHNPSTECDCDKDALYGEKRDVVVKYDGKIYHFYHQTPIVINIGGGMYRIANGGYKTMSTKTRINNILPLGFKVFQRDFEWYVETPNGEIGFIEGIKLDTN